MLKYLSYCVGFLGRHAVLIAVTVEFSESHSVGVGDFLCSVNGLSTTLLSASAMDSVLETNIETFEVVTKLNAAAAAATAAIVTAVAAARPQNLSKEQLSINKHGFYAKGTY